MQAGCQEGHDSGLEDQQMGRRDALSKKTEKGKKERKKKRVAAEERERTA